MTDSDAAGLEARLKIVEDKLAIYELIASHPPSADTGSADYTSSVYLEDGVFDRGPTLDGATGVENIAAFTLRPAHEQAIRDGLAHFAGLPLIDLDGDRAVVTSYLMIIHLDHEGRSRELPNHGASQGYRIHRVVSEPVGARAPQSAMDDRKAHAAASRWIGAPARVAASGIRRNHQ